MRNPFPVPEGRYERLLLSESSWGKYNSTGSLQEAHGGKNERGETVARCRSIMRIRENELVQKISGSAAQRRISGQLRLGAGDDAALFEPRPGYELILTCDWFLEGTHFLRDKHPPDSVGWKCLARAASDVAA